MNNVKPASSWTDGEWNTFKNWISGVLKETTVTVTFMKKDGSERVMKCTLDPMLLPPAVVNENRKPKAIPENSLAVYDVEARGWRSFIVKSVKEVQFTLG